MSTIARLEVIPTRGGNMSEAVASAVGALDQFDVSYETTPTDTVIEADDPAEVFAAAEAAHRAVADERVITSLEVDEHRGRRQNRHERVASVERALGRPPERERRGTERGSRQLGIPTTGTPEAGTESGTAETELRRYHGPVPTDQQGGSRSAGTQPIETQQTGVGSTGSRGADSRRGADPRRGTDSRYLQSGRRPSR